MSVSLKVIDTKMMLLMNNCFYLLVAFVAPTLLELDALAQPAVPQLKLEEVTERSEEGFLDTSRSSSTDLLDAFSFFDPSAKPPATEPPSKMMNQNNLISPQINIIMASTENLTEEDDMSFFETQSQTVTTPAPRNDATANFDPLNSLSTEEESSESAEENEEDFINRPIKRDDTVDFDEILARPPAQDAVVDQPSDVWQNCDDSGIGKEFRATFTVRDSRQWP